MIYIIYNYAFFSKVYCFLLWFYQKVVLKEEIGPSFERAVHGNDHVHDHKSDGPARKIIKFKDIVDLELGEQMLKGDLFKYRI